MREQGTAGSATKDEAGEKQTRKQRAPDSPTEDGTR